MKQADSFEELYRQVRLRKVPFFVAFAVIVTLTYSFLYILDFIPEPITEEVTEEAVEETEIISESEAVSEISEPVSSVVPVKIEISEPAVVSGSAKLPRSIYIDALDKEIKVLNPDSRVIADLDEALLSGVVRHPDSADFSEDGNVFILGHSSYLPNVFNKNFQAFNGIQNLAWGDTIRVNTDDTEYIYRVQEVYKAKASAVFVPNTPGEARLTLATCNSFGSKDDRFMVEAVLVDTKTL